MDFIIKDAYLLAVTLIAWISKSKSGRWYFLYVYPTKGSNQKSIKKPHKFITERNKNERKWTWVNMHFTNLDIQIANKHIEAS